MKSWFLLLSILPLAAQVYVSWRVWRMLPALPAVKVAAVALMALALVSFFVAMAGWIDKMPMSLATAIYETGTSWMVILLYLFMYFLVLDIGCWTHIVPKSITHHSVTGSIATLALMAVIFTCAHLRYETKQRVAIDLKTNKPLPHSLKVVLVSDLHLGYHNRRADLKRWIGLINSEHADAVLIAGDLVDRYMRPVMEERYYEEFRHINAPVYFAFGNHDYYSGLEAEREFCHLAGIRILQDSVASLAGVNVVGRDDLTNARRHSLKQLTQAADPSKFTILLDHQPHRLAEAERCAVDFQFSGHTHYGQIWPGNWITHSIYECPYGPWQRGDTRYYVSSGLGIWGAKFRIGTQSEYIVATIHN